MWCIKETWKTKINALRLQNISQQQMAHFYSSRPLESKGKHLQIASLCRFGVILLNALLYGDLSVTNRVRTKVQQNNPSDIVQPHFAVADEQVAVVELRLDDDIPVEHLGRHHL